MPKHINIIGKRYGKLVVLKELDRRQNRRIICTCKCDCGNKIDVKKVYLTTNQTRSCGCDKLKQDSVNLRDGYNSKRIDDVAMHLFKDKKPRKDSSTGYRGVSKYYTRKSKQLRYRAWLTVKGKQYYKSGFLTPHDAYYNGRLMLEDKYLPGGRKNG